MLYDWRRGFHDFDVEFLYGMFVPDAFFGELEFGYGYDFCNTDDDAMEDEGFC